MISAEHVVKLKGAIAAIGQATAILNDLPDEVTDEYGDLSDAVSKLEEAGDLIEGVLPDDAGPNPANPA